LGKIAENRIAEYNKATLGMLTVRFHGGFSPVLMRAPSEQLVSLLPAQVYILGGLLYKMREPYEIAKRYYHTARSRFSFLT
jgi:hypothetical protein